MKNIQSAIVIAALLGASNAVKIGRTNSEFEGMPISFAQTYQASFAEYEGKLKGKSEAELFALVDSKIQEAKDKSKDGEPEKEGKKEDAVAKDAEAKALEKMVAEKLYGRISGERYPYAGTAMYGYNNTRYPYEHYGYGDPRYGGYGAGYGYGYPAAHYGYPYAPDIAGHVAAVAAYHDVIMRHEAANAIAGLVAPSAGVALDLINEAREAGAAARKVSDGRGTKTDDKIGDKSDKKVEKDADKPEDKSTV